MVSSGTATACVSRTSLTGEGVRVAIIDTGVDPTHPAIGRVAAGVTIKTGPDGGVVEEEGVFLDEVGHGTAVAAIARKLAPGCELLAVKVVPDERGIAPEGLVAAIAWAVRRGADVINVSSGTTGTGSLAALTCVCTEAAEAGSVVIAAEGHDGRLSYPAALDSVLRVGHCLEERTFYGYCCDPREPGRFLAYGGTQRVAWLDPRYVFLEGTSFACPRVAGAVALMIQSFGRMPRERLLQVLRENSLDEPTSQSTVEPTGPPNGRRQSVAWIGRAAIYPYSKEMHSLVRFRHLLPFKLVGVADHPVRGHVGRDAGEAIGEAPAGLRIQAALDDALEGADTLILGFTGKLGSLLGRDVVGELAARAATMGKNVYSFEPFNAPKGDPTAHVGWPRVNAEDLDALRAQAASLRQVSYDRVPVLGVFGTSPSQGKFTLQLRLREHLSALGLTVGQVGTEHQSVLFGMDDGFPLGHVNAVDLEPRDWPEYLDLRYRQIVRDRDPDIIIVGAQGGVILPGPGPASSADLGASWKSLHFLASARADSFVLAVNHLDDHAFIADTIDVLRAVGKGRTVLLALSTRRKAFVESFGRRRMVDDVVGLAEQSAHLHRLEDKFGLPAVSILDPEGPSRLIDAVLAAYSPPRTDP
jgi:uncharacterized NAD-dependent epimerase/dehydratase family protein